MESFCGVLVEGDWPTPERAQRINETESEIKRRMVRCWVLTLGLVSRSDRLATELLKGSRQPLGDVLGGAAFDLAARHEVD